MTLRKDTSFFSLRPSFINFRQLQCKSDDRRLMAGHHRDMCSESIKVTRRSQNYDWRTISCNWTSLSNVGQISVADKAIQCISSQATSRMNSQKSEWMHNKLTPLGLSDLPHLSFIQCSVAKVRPGAHFNNKLPGWMRWRSSIIYLSAGRLHKYLWMDFICLLIARLRIKNGNMWASVCIALQL